MTDKYGVPRDVGPSEAMVEELRRTVGHVDFLERQIGGGSVDAGWLSVYQNERAHLAKLSQQMISLKTDERKTVLTAQTVDALERALYGIVRSLGHDPDDPHVRAVIARHLRDAATSSPAPALPHPQPAVIDNEKSVRDEPRPEPVAF